MTILACGVGIAPHRVRNADDLAFRSELDWLATHRGVRVISLLGHRADRPSWLPRGYPGSDVDSLRAVAPDLARHHVFICGPDGWTEAVRAAARTIGVPAERLHTERFAW